MSICVKSRTLYTTFVNSGKKSHAVHHFGQIVSKVARSSPFLVSWTQKSPLLELPNTKLSWQKNKNTIKKLIKKKNERTTKRKSINISINEQYWKDVMSDERFHLFSHIFIIMPMAYSSSLGSSNSCLLITLNDYGE